jgi:hypothetical protein
MNKKTYGTWKDGSNIYKNKKGYYVILWNAKKEEEYKKYLSNRSKYFRKNRTYKKGGANNNFNYPTNSTNNECCGPFGCIIPCVGSSVNSKTKKNFRASSNNSIRTTSSISSTSSTSSQPRNIKNISKVRRNRGNLYYLNGYKKNSSETNRKARHVLKNLTRRKLQSAVSINTNSNNSINLINNPPSLKRHLKKITNKNNNNSQPLSFEPTEVKLSPSSSEKSGLSKMFSY